jgi:hypothetical protein
MKMWGEERKYEVLLSPASCGTGFVKGFAGVSDYCEIMPNLLTAVAPGCTI